MVTDQQINYVNLTPHEIVIVRPERETLRIPPSGTVLRVKTESLEVSRTKDGIPIHKVVPLAESLSDAMWTIRSHLYTPDEPWLCNYVILSGLALDWLEPRLTDEESVRVLAPDTGPGSVVRDAHGRIAGVQAFRRSQVQ